jgi:hypothetical protein
VRKDLRRRAPCAALGMTYRELVRLLAKVTLAEDTADQHEAELVLGVLTDAEEAALYALERAARWN